MNEHILSLQDKGKEESKKHPREQSQGETIGKKVNTCDHCGRGIITRRIVGREWENALDVVA